MPEIPDEIKKFLLDENHIYFTKILKEDELMNMNENVFYEIMNFQTPPFLPKEVIKSEMIIKTIDL